MTEMMERECEWGDVKMSCDCSEKVIGGATILKMKIGDESSGSESSDSKSRSSESAKSEVVDMESDVLPDNDSPGCRSVSSSSISDGFIGALKVPPPGADYAGYEEYYSWMAKLIRESVASDKFESKPVVSADSGGRKLADLALKYYKEKKGVEYEYVGYGSSCTSFSSVYGFGTHANFFARLKGTQSTPELFFAELENGSPQKVLECCLLNPRPYSLGETRPPGVLVFHCPHVECLNCNKFIGYNDSDIEEDNDGDDDFDIETWVNGM